MAARDHAHSTCRGDAFGATEGGERTAVEYITPRKSWPRPTEPVAMMPNWAGEFRDFDDWVSFAQARLTGTYDPMMGHEVPAICVDAFGRRCTAGGHFRRAREEGAFPVRFFWDLTPLQNAAPVSGSAEGVAVTQSERPKSNAERGSTVMSKCPTCRSPAPHLHPAVQREGEVHICADAFHLTPTPQNVPAYIRSVEELRAERGLKSNAQ